MTAARPSGLRALGDVQLMLVLPGLRLVLQTRQGLPDAQLRRMRRAVAAALGLLEHQVLVVSPVVDLAALVQAQPEPQPPLQDEAGDEDGAEAQSTQDGCPGRGRGGPRPSRLAPRQPAVDEDLALRLAGLARALAAQRLEGLQ